MKIIFLPIFILLSMPSIVQAQESAAMKDAVCKLLALQTQKSNQTQQVAGATYQEGVDAYGRAVAPASIDAAGEMESLIIPIEIDLAEKFDIPNIENVGEAKVGTAEIQSDGRVIFGKNDITSKVHDWCGTPVPKGLDIKKPEIETPVVDKPKIQTTEINGPMVEINQPEKVEMQPVEIKPVIAQPPVEIPLEVESNKASNDTNVQNVNTNTSDKITGTDYRDYNE